MDAWIAGVIFFVAYALIATERFDRTLAALLGGLLVIVFGVLDQHEAFAAVDFNVIFLLAGMMIIAGALGKTGLFEWLAIRSVKMSRGEPYRLLVILTIVTAVLAAFLDNVTTVVLIAPVTLSIATKLKISPLPFLISQILASNIGGTATLIGDPPNILIGSAAGLDFGAFLFNLGPVVVIIFAAFLVTTRFMFGPSLSVEHEDKKAVLALNEGEAIRDRGLLIRGLIVVGFTMVGFLLHSQLHLEPATVAMLGATVLLLVGHLDVDKALHEVEWSTLLFFVGSLHPRRRASSTLASSAALPIARRGSRRQRRSRDDRAALVLGDRFRRRRQHPLHSHGHPGRPAACRIRPRGAAVVVGARAGSLPRRQSHDRRGIRQRGRRQHGRPGRPPDQVLRVPRATAPSSSRSRS